MTTLRIALAQIRQSADIEDNRLAILQAVDDAVTQSVQILCFPETQTVGYRVDISTPGRARCMPRCANCPWALVCNRVAT